MATQQTLANENESESDEETSNDSIKNEDTVKKVLATKKKKSKEVGELPNYELAYQLKKYIWKENIECMEALDIVKMLKRENGEMLDDMSKLCFLEKAKIIYENKSHRKFCSICLKTFWNRRNRDIHMTMIHKNQKDEKLTCKLCEKTFMSKEASKYHNDTCHASSSSKVKCKICDETLSHKVSLKRHMQIHKKDSFKCDKCQKEFTRKDNLTKHKKIVHYETSIQFDQLGLMEEGDGSSKCKICNKVFSGSDKEDIITHLAEVCKQEDKLNCEKCKTDFSTQDRNTMKKRQQSLVGSVISRQISRPA